ncbi:MAG: helix-turn-helix domain-containing protein, partial [Gemmatimonadales bacterium]
PDLREGLLALLRSGGHQAVAAPSPAAAADALGGPGFDALVVDPSDPEIDLGRLRSALGPASPTDPESLASVERRHIALVLRHTGGNRRRAAALLGISRSTLLHKVRKYRLDAP